MPDTTFAAEYAAASQTIGDPTARSALLRRNMAINNTLIGALGDSITANPDEGGTRGRVVNARAWLSWAATASSGRFAVGYNVGFPGAKVDAIVASTMPEFLAAPVRPGYVVLLQGTNDVGQMYQNQFQGGTNTYLDGTPVTMAKSLGYLAAEYDYLIGLGYNVIAATIPPRSDHANQKLVMQWNVGVMELARQRNLLCVDFFSVLYDPATALGGYKAGYSTDGIHPNGVGAYQMGGALNALLSFLPAGKFPSVTVPGTAYINGTNQRMLVDTSPADNIPDGFGTNGGSGTATLALVDDAAAPNSKVWQITNTDAAGTLEYHRQTPFAMVAGNWVQFMFRYQFVAGTGPATFNIRLRSFNVGNSGGGGLTDILGISMNTTVAVPSTGGMRTYYGLAKVPAGVTFGTVEVGVAGLNSVLGVTDVGVQDLTVLGITPA
jgi:lysophospholipase L1-like esterase